MQGLHLSFGVGKESWPKHHTLPARLEAARAGTEREGQAPSVGDLSDERAKRPTVCGLSVDPTKVLLFGTLLGMGRGRMSFVRWFGKADEDLHRGRVEARSMRKLDLADEVRLVLTTSAGP